MQALATQRTHRGSVLIIVIWSIAILALIVAATQVVSYRTAALGAKSLERVQSRWAARAGVEQAIAMMSSHNENPDQGDALGLMRGLEDVSGGNVQTGSWQITHILDGQEFFGPLDESAKLNVNTLSSLELLELDLDGLSQDVVDAIIDWRDDDDEPGLMGAEVEFYRNRNLAYEPRNADVRSIAELELVAGVWPESLRGADIRLTNKFDPTEEPGWAEFLTAYTYTTGKKLNGEDKFRLDEAEPQEVAEYFGLTLEQANEVIEFAGGGDNVELESIIAQNIGNSDGNSSGRGISSRRTGRSSGGSSAGAAPLTNDQYRLIIDEGWIGELDEIRPGRLNVNTATQTALETIFSFDPSLAEDVIALRDSREGGITSIVDLLEAGRMTPEFLGAVGHRLTTTGSVYSITSRGRSKTGDIETAMFVVVDRSTLPIQILEYREE